MCIWSGQGRRKNRPEWWPVKGWKVMTRARNGVYWSPIQQVEWEDGRLSCSALAVKDKAGIFVFKSRRDAEEYGTSRDVVVQVRCWGEMKWFGTRGIYNSRPGWIVQHARIVE